MHKNNPFNRVAVAGLLALTVLSGVPANTSAQAPTTSDLQTRIQELLARINALQGDTNASSGLSAYQWSTPFGIGTNSEQVRELQRLLNNDPDTRVAASGIGSKGNETTYYGPATAAAVSKFQVKYRNEVLTPSGLVNPTGYFGLATLTKANKLRKAVVTPPSPTTPTNPTTPTPSPTNPIELNGEGELDNVQLEQANDTDIEEAASDAPAALVTFEADNGDIRITRLDLALIAESSNGEKDPWDTFEDISLWIDGKKIAEKNIDRKTDYQDDRKGTIRLSGLDMIIEDGEEQEVTIALTLKNNIKGAGSAASWKVAVNGLRYYDGEGVSSDDRTTGDLGDSIAFTIVERGEGEELKFSLNRNNPEASTIVVDESKRTNNATILEYEIEAIDNDIELETLAIAIETGPVAFSSVVNEVRLVINGRTFRSDSIVTTGDYSTTSVLALFDIDNKITISEDDVESIKVIVDLKPSSGYQNGQTITARISTRERDMTKAEGADDVREFSGTVIGEEHRLIAEGIDTPINTVRFATNTQGENSTTGIFSITFDVAAVEGDFYIRDFASTTIDSNTGGIGYSIEGAAAYDTLSATLSSSADEESPNVFVVREGRAETFTLSVTADPTTAGQFRVALREIISSESDDGTSNSQTYTINPINRYRTPYQFINN